MSNFLSQEEIDALLKGDDNNNDLEDNEINDEKIVDEVSNMPITDIEKDALGEIGNISMGSAATALSQLLNQRVNITTPKVKIISPKELIETFQVPYMVIEVNFTEGIEGYNFLIIKVSDSSIVADLMMGGDGTNTTIELTEIHTSALAEAMNQMMGSAATSMSTMFNKYVNISPPRITSVDIKREGVSFPWENDDSIVVVSFNLVIGDLINSEMHQVLSIKVAKKETMLLMGKNDDGENIDEHQNNNLNYEEITEDIDDNLKDYINFSNPTEQINNNIISNNSTIVEKKTKMPRNIDLILDVPLNVSVILGKTKKPIKEVLNLIPGSIVELEKFADEPVDILVNGKLIAHGEVIVVNENFGIKITSIESPVERLKNLKE